MNEIVLPDGSVIGDGGEDNNRGRFALWAGIIGALIIGAVVYLAGDEIGVYYAAPGYHGFRNYVPAEFAGLLDQAKFSPYFEMSMKAATALLYAMAFFSLVWFIPAVRGAWRSSYFNMKIKPANCAGRIFRTLLLGFIVYFGLFAIPDIREFLTPLFATTQKTMALLYILGWSVLPGLIIVFMQTKARNHYRIPGFVLGIVISIFGVAALLVEPEIIGIGLLIFWWLWGFAFFMFLASIDQAIKARKTINKNDRLTRQAKGLHGDARFANFEEIEAYGMTQTITGMPAGNFLLGHFPQNGQPIFSPYDEHIITFAKARSGKGTGSIIPNLLMHKGSALVIDPKGENAAVTARYRRDVLGQKVYLLNPFGLHKEQFEQMGFKESTHGFNPIRAAYDNDEKAVSIAKQVAQTLVPDKRGNTDDFWANRSRGMIYALILNQVYHGSREECNLEHVLDLLSHPAEQLQEVFQQMLEKGVNKAIKRAAGKMLAIKSERTQGSIIGGAQDALDFLDLEQMANVTNRHDFELSDLKNDKVTVYMILPVEHLETCAGWLRLMVERTLAVMTEVSHVPDKPVLFLLDEAARLGRIEKLASAPAALPGYGVRVWPIFQSLGQLKHLYGGSEWEDIIANSTMQVFGINDNSTAKYISERLGSHGMVIETYSQGENYNELSATGKSTGSNTSIHKKQLMSLEKLIGLNESSAIVMIAHKRPIMVQKAKYFEMLEFKEDQKIDGKPLYDKNPYYKGDG